MDWYVVHVRRGLEQATALGLAHGFCLTTYCPHVLQRQRGETLAGPLFPGYFFVCAPSSGESLQVIERTAGWGLLVRSLPPVAVQPGAAPTFARLPGDLIDRLCCRLAVVNAAGGLPAALLTRSSGDPGGSAAASPAQADADKDEQEGEQDGALDDGQDGELTCAQAGGLDDAPAFRPHLAAAGLEAALDGLLSPAARVRVLLQVCHGCQPDTDPDAGAGDGARLAAGNDLFKRPRRTRGHGRRIHYY